MHARKKTNGAAYRLSRAADLQGQREDLRRCGTRGGIHSKVPLVLHAIPGRRLGRDERQLRHAQHSSQSQRHAASSAESLHPNTCRVEEKAHVLRPEPAQQTGAGAQRRSARLKLKLKLRQTTESARRLVGWKQTPQPMTMTRATTKSDVSQTQAKHRRDNTKRSLPSYWLSFCLLWLWPLAVCRGSESSPSHATPH